MNAKIYIDLVKEGIHVDEDYIEESIKNGKNYVDFFFHNISDLSIEVAGEKINNYLRKFDYEEGGILYEIYAKYKEKINGQVRFSLFAYKKNTIKGTMERGT